MLSKVEIVPIVEPTEEGSSLLECETVLAAGNGELHEGQISLTHGFVPYQPVESLPPESGCAAFEKLAEHFPQIMVTAAEREKIAELPVLDSKVIADLPDKYLARLSAILGNASHLYYYNLRKGHTQDADPLPANLREPWEQLCARIGRKLVGYEPGKLRATRGHYDAFFNAWEIDDPSLLDGVRNGDVTLDNLSLSMPVFGNNEERVFVLTIVLMELRFAVAFPHIFKAIKAVANRDDAALIEALKSIVSVVESVTDALDYLTANEHSKHYVDPTLWSKTIAKFDGEIPGGLRGLSASVFPLFHTLDSLIERQDYDTVLGKAIVEKFEAQPSHIRDFISAMRRDIAKHSLRDYVEKSDNPLLKSQYQSLMDVYLGGFGLTKIHSDKAAAYIKINFRTGRLETNGKNRGTATAETEEQRVIIKNFADADAERKKHYLPHPHYATRIRLAPLGDRATEVVLDVSEAGLDFSPGDHCAVLPMNYPDEIDAIVKKYRINPDDEIPLNALWKKFFFNKLGLDTDVVQMGFLLTYADFSKLNQWQLAPVDIDSISPLSERFYSVSPLVTPGQVRLTVAKHFQIGATGEPTVGKASGYLVHPMTTSILINKISARSFHLPPKPETPIIMFGAGTGISPFMGFIKARKGPDKGLTWLFLGESTRSDFHYADELKQAVQDGDLKLDVVFSRERDFDTAEFDEETKDFVFKKKYEGHHVDELIKSNATQLGDLIIGGAHIYVCGSNGFGDTVRDTLKLALLTHMTEVEADEYLLHLQAEHRYHSDVFTPTHALQSPQLARPIFRSELAYHNKMDDCWAAVHDKVYDLTRFALVHPGGRKIIQLGAGTDMSEDFKAIKHDQNPVIQAQLAHLQVGVLAKPDFKSEKAAFVYQKALKYLDALIETQDTLVNSSTFRDKEKPAYLWREVFNVYIQGHLQAYDPKGSVGSFTYVFSKLLSELVESLGLPGEYFNSVYLQLFRLTNQCADAIRNATLESNEVKIKKVELIFDHLLTETLKFTEEMKLGVITFITKLETTGEFDSDLDASLVSDLIRGNETTMQAYLESLTKIDAVLSLEGSSFSHPFVPSMLTGGVCPFMPTARAPVMPTEKAATAPLAVAAAGKPVDAAISIVKATPPSSGESLFTAMPKYARSAYSFFSSLVTSGVSQVVQTVTGNYGTGGGDAALLGEPTTKKATV